MLACIVSACILCALPAGAAPIERSARAGSGEAASADTRSAEASAPSYTGAGSCGSAQCHGSQRPRTLTRVRQDEYVVWVLKDHHANSYRTLLGDRSVRIARNLRLPDPAEKTERCLDCHAVNAPPSRRGRTFDMSDGVSCEGCHGPAEKWLGPHTTRDWTHHQSLSAGMYDTKNLLLRARRCLSCHLGDESRSVDHELIAAGHPDLVFELDTFTAAMPMHWKESEDKGAWFDVRAWGVGQALALGAAMDRLARRARKGVMGSGSTDGLAAAGSGGGAGGPARAGPGNSIWPEFSEYECFTCHHDLKKDSWRQARGYEQSAGAPSWNSSRHAVFRLLYRQIAASEAAAVESDLQGLSALMAAGGSDRQKIAEAAGRVSAAVEHLATRLAETASTPSADSTRSLLHSIAAEADGLAFAGYRVAEQATMAIDSLYRPLARNAKPASDAAIRKGIDRLYDDLKDPARYDPRSFSSDLKAVQKSLP